MKIQNILFVIVAAALTGCSVFDFPTDKKIHVISEPPGAAIEVNDNYVGKTPCDITLEVGPTLGRILHSYAIVATPQGAGEIKRKLFKRSDVPPEIIYFNTNIVTSAPMQRTESKVDLNVTSASK